MMNIRFVLVFILLSASLYAQEKVTFDIATFIPPRGWERESVDFAASFLKINKSTGGWCRISIYKSVESSGDSRLDFNNE